MKRIVLITLLAAAAVSPLSAQAAAIFPEQPLEPNRARVRDAVYVLRDTLQPVIATIARLQRDFRKSSPQLMSSRARELVTYCAAAERNVAPVQTVVVKTKVVGKTATQTRLKRAQHARLQRQLDSLDLTLTRCSTEFTRLSQPGNAEEMRGYGSRRAQPVREGILKYEDAVDGFFRSMEIPNRPLGAGPIPLAN